MNKPINSNYVMIDKPIIEDKKLVFKLSYSENLNQYFFYDQIDIQYNVDINGIDNSVLYIPAVATIISIAWAVGADVFVENIDENYLHSLDNVKSIFSKWFPQFSFSTRIQAQNIVNNKYDSKGYALLYSGGIDSLTSLLRNRDKHPALISVWGAEGSSHEYDQDKQFKLWKDNFLSINLDGLELYYIRTNTGNLVNQNLLAKNYINDGDWFELVSHGLIYTGLSAPITTVKKVANLIMASSFSKYEKVVNGSDVFNLAEMNWANTKVILDSGDLSRQDKIRVISGNTKYYHLIKVCHLYKSKRFNCSTPSCEKCARTIIGLIMENIDPNECNFRVNKGTLSLLKVYFENGWIPIDYIRGTFFWTDIQVHIHDHKINNSYNAASFFGCLKDFKFSDYKYQNGNGMQLIKKFYYSAKYDPLFAFEGVIQRVSLVIKRG